MISTTQALRKRSSGRLRALRSDRRGAVLPIMVACLVVLLVMAAFSVDVAYMQLTRTQLRAASDAAAKAGVQSLTSSQNLTTAQNACIAMAARNKVNGKGLIVTASEMEFGQSIAQADGSWSFSPNTTPYRAMRLKPSLKSSNSNGLVNLFFGKMLGTSTFSPSTTSVASVYEQEVCLVLDRSHSMCFDQSGNDWSYPSPIYSDWQKGIKNKPQTGSRWLALEAGVQQFVSVLGTINAPPRVAVVTWGSDIGKNTTEYSLTGKTASAVTFDQALTDTLSLVNTAVHSHSTDVMLGGTNMSAGMVKGISVLTAAGVKVYADKVMVLMTDGQWNQGTDPLDTAQDAKDAGITIHCITFLPDGDQTTMQEIADLTGGKHYYAANATALEAAFRDLALSLPIVLTQ